ncbi:MAG: phage holin family protein [Acidobacteriota bacterium]
MSTPARDERSLGELFTELSRETGTLIRKEVELATTEMTAKAKVAGGHVGMVAAGGALAHAGLLVILAAFVVGLAQLGITPWLAAAIVGVLTAGIGYLLVDRGLAALRQTSVAPTRAIEAMKETTTWTTRQKV